MSSCDLSIELEDTNREFRAGETITGRVTVEVDDEVTCDGLTISLFWRTHGSGDENQGDRKTKTLFEGTWRKGETREYTFQFEAPDHPLSYHGEHVNVDWYLQANADIPWAFDPQAEKDVLVVENPDTPPREPSREIVSEAEEKTGQQKPNLLWIGFRVLLGTFFSAIGLWILYTSLQENAWFGIIFGTVFSASGGFLIAFSIWNYVAQMSFDNLRVEIDPLVVAPGEPVRCQVAFTPDSRVQLNGIELTLKGVERAVHNHGTDSTTYTETISTHTQALPEAEGTYRKGTTRKISSKMSIPEDAPPTFHADDNDITWLCDVHIDIDGWPDWSKEFPVNVVR